MDRGRKKKKKKKLTASDSNVVESYPNVDGGRGCAFYGLKKLCSLFQRIFTAEEFESIGVVVFFRWAVEIFVGICLWWSWNASTELDDHQRRKDAEPFFSSSLFFSAFLAFFLAFFSASVSWASRKIIVRGTKTVQERNNENVLDDDIKAVIIEGSSATWMNI